MALRPCSRYRLAVSKRLPIEAEIRSLLQRAEAAGETVENLARLCLKRFRLDCGAACEHYQKRMMEVMSSGNPFALVEVALERDERIDQAREDLKTRLAKLLAIADEKKL